MKRLLLFLFCMSPVWLSAAQPTPPDWVDPVLREERYPAGTYFTGFVSVSRNQYEDKEAAYARVRQEARVEAVASIQVSVEQTVEHFLQNTQNHGDVSTYEVMTMRSGIKTTIKDVPGLNVEVWENTKTGDICAFAWVKSADLYKKLMRRIAVNLSKAEAVLNSVETRAGSGDKMQARHMLAEISPILDGIENDQFIMLGIDATTTDEDLSLRESKQVKERFLSLTAKLKNSIAVCIDCTAELFGTSYMALKSEIQGALSDLGVMFVDDADRADWVIRITARAREYNKVDYGNASAYFVYTDAQISIEKTADGKRIYENSISEKGTHTLGYEQAARDAYEHLSVQLGGIVREQITK